MKSRLRYFIVLAAVIAAVVFALLVNRASAPIGDRREPAVEIGNLAIPVELARTGEEWNRGLSGRSALDAGSGMLFIFPRPGTYAFWMPDMHFPIDIIWIDEHLRIIGIHENLPPLEGAAKPVYYRPPSPAQYVLEVNAGFARSRGIAVGDRLSLRGVE